MNDMKSGADILAKQLKALQVEKIFAITGAGNLALLNALMDEPGIQLIYMHHEQAAVMAAQGYARTSGTTGVAIVTTGGGTSNAFTGILSAYLDSVPLVVISGNESSYHFESMKNMRAIGVQGFISTNTSANMTKLSKVITNANEIVDIIREAFVLAGSDRKGPVHLDFPMDLQRKLVDIKNQKIDFLDKSNKELLSSDLASVSPLVIEARKILLNSKKPLFYLGNGLRNSQYLQPLISFLEMNKLPFCLTWSAVDLVPDMHPMNFGRLGIYGNRHSNIILQQSDALFCIGTRLSIPQVGYDINDFGRNAKKIIVDIDKKELQKFSEDVWLKIPTSVDTFIKFAILDNPIEFVNDHIDWLSRINTIKQKLPVENQVGLRSKDNVHSYDVVNFLNDNSEEGTVFVTDVGAGLLSGHYGIKIKRGQRFFTSQGLGEMGFGLPGSIGAYFAATDKKIICLNTDGGIMFNLQELQVVRHHKIPLKLFIFNNNGYTMIKYSQENLFGGRLTGSTPETGVSFPSFKKLATCFDFSYIRIEKNEDLSLRLREVLNSDVPTIIEIIMSEEQIYLPRLATKKMPSGQLSSPPIEDLDPLLPIEQLEDLLGYKASLSSYEIRNLAKKNE